MKKLLQLMLVTAGILALASNVHAGRKSDVCHKGDDGEFKTIRISNNALSAHLNHGDVLGKCEDIPTEKAVVIFRCGSDLGALAVTSVSLSLNVPEDAPEVTVGSDCAETNANLMNGGFKLEQVNAGAGTELETEYLYTGEFLAVEPVVPE